MNLQEMIDDNIAVLEAESNHKEIPFKSFNKIYQIENKKIEIV